MGVVEFVTARLDEREALARAAGCVAGWALILAWCGTGL